jgi:NAD(P)-dependent dehydrogenase (short-subunit alcohol dehydrogenase family)
MTGCQAPESWIALSKIMRNHTLVTGAGMLTGIVAARFLLASSPYDFRNKIVLVTGGSRGLGLLLAREFSAHGARVAICARDHGELDAAAQIVRRDFSGKSQFISGDILTIEADVTMRDEAEAAVQRVRDKLGPIDVLVNNAGVITVGPVETTTIDDYRASLNTHFWGPYFTTMAVLPEMQKRRSGRVVNISSIGGKISVPHLLPYSVGKFALTGFSEGLRSELLKSNVYVTTVCPGLMRTGSPRNALFKGKNEAEYAWFSVSDALPLISMGAERAARQVVRACGRGTAEVVLSIPAKLAVKIHGIAPGTTTDFLSLVNRLLPGPGGIGKEVRTGKQSFSGISPSWLTTLNETAAKRNNEIA